MAVKFREKVRIVGHDPFIRVGNMAYFGDELSSSSEMRVSVMRYRGMKSDLFGEFFGALALFHAWCSRIVDSAVPRNHEPFHRLMKSFLLNGAGDFSSAYFVYVIQSSRLKSDLLV